MSIQKKSLVILSAFYDPYMSGAEQMVKQIVENFGDKYEITLITGRYDKVNPKEEKRQTFKLVRIGIGHKQIDKLLYIILAPFVARKYKPDIAHAIMESYAGGALVFLKYVYPQTKRILTLQSGDLDDGKKQSVWYINLFWKIIHRSPDIVTAISTALAKRAIGLGVSEDRVFITNNGLDFSEVPEGISKESGRVICVGRLSWEKAHKYILNAWPQVLEKYAGSKLFFAGEGPERGSIENQIKEMGLQNSVILLGNLPHKQTLIEISQSEVFICPSLAEGFGNVFVEAQACGVPPIGTRVGGIPDIIQDGENGLLIEPKNSDQIAEAILRLFDDKELAERMGQMGKISSRKFEWKKILKDIDEIYLKLT